MYEVLQGLTPMQARLYECRMGVTPPRTVAECAALLGVQRQSVQNTWVRLKKRLDFDPLKQAKQLGHVHRTGKPGGDENTTEEALVAVNPEVLARRLEMKAELALKAITPEKVREASAPELARTVKDLLTMRAEIRGSPIQSLSALQRRKLFEMMPTFVKEAQRRGFSFEIDPVTGEFRTYKKIKGQPKVLEAQLLAVETAP